MSKDAQDNFFYLNYDFLNYIEQLNKGKKIDGELEHEWQMRRTREISDLLHQMYRWIDKPVDNSQSSFDQWLQELILPWYLQRVS